MCAAASQQRAGARRTGEVFSGASWCGEPRARLISKRRHLVGKMGVNWNLPRRVLRELVVISVRLYIWGQGGLLREDSVSLDSAGAPVRGDPCGPVLLAWRAQCLLQDVAGPAATWAVVCVMQVSTGRHGSGLLARLCCSAACKSDTSVGTRWSYVRVG